MQIPELMKYQQNFMKNKGRSRNMMLNVENLQNPRKNVEKQ